jgi:hypothetical protein
MITRRIENIPNTTVGNGLLQEMDLSVVPILP